MKGLDANVLVRYLVQDDPKQAKLAVSFIETFCTVMSPVLLARLFCVSWRGFWKVITTKTAGK